MLPQKIDSYLDLLGKTSEHASLFSLARRLHEDQSVFFKLIPEQLAQHCNLGRITEGRLTIRVENGAVAAKLKQISPSLLRKLQQRGWEVTAFQILVQAQSPWRNTKPFGKQGHRKKELKLSQTGKECLNQLAATLPDSELRSAIQIFLKKQQNG